MTRIHFLSCYSAVYSRGGDTLVISAGMSLIGEDETPLLVPSRWSVWLLLVSCRQNSNTHDGDIKHYVMWRNICQQGEKAALKSGR